MPGTGEALLIALVSVVPGALFEWAFERQVGRWNDAATDRLIRFVASAAIIHVIAFPITHSVWRGHVMDGQLELGEGLPLAIRILPTFTSSTGPRSIQTQALGNTTRVVRPSSRRW